MRIGRVNKESRLTASMADAPFFFGAAPFWPAKKEPKKDGSSFLGSTSRSLLLLTTAFEVLGSVFCCGLF